MSYSFPFLLDPGSAPYRIFQRKEDGGREPASLGRFSTRCFGDTWGLCGSWSTWSSNDKVDWGGVHAHICCHCRRVSSGLWKRSVRLYYEGQLMREVANVLNVSVGFVHHVVPISARSTVSSRARPTAAWL